MVSGLKKKKIAEIERSINSVSKLLESTKRKSFLSGWFRFGILAGGTALYFSFYFASLFTISLISALIFVMLFVYASVIQSRLITLVEKQKKWIEIKKSHLARINLDWQNIPHFKNFEDSEPSILESDLDLTGNRSLHQLIDYTRSQEGSALLREFLISHPENCDDIIKRQSIIKELLSVSHFRERFLLTSGLASNKEINDSSLIGWLNNSAKSGGLGKILKFLFPLYLINLLLIVLMITGIIAPGWGPSSIIYIGFYFLNQSKIRTIMISAEKAGDHLKKIAGILSFIENYNFGSNKHLAELASPLKIKNQSPTRLLNKINFYLDTIALRNNPIVFLLFMIVFPLDYFLAYKIELRKNLVASSLNYWLASWHNFEVYVALAVFANLNPEYKFPVIKKAGHDSIEINSTEMGHPLIPAAQKVCNNYTTSGLHNISIITGSNMSGKSTFLRTIGINLCLAYSGAPVNASSFAFSPARLFTCIKVSDSVIDGISYFYAEVKRLKLLLDEIDKEGRLPLIYLIDEIFKGTNNIERLQGSRSLIKTLTSKKGTGLISTHDLELVKLSEDSRSIINFHFREEIKEGKMLFDYKINNGPCPTTNALLIMKTNGLPVE